MRPIDADELIVTECGMCDGACDRFNGKACLNCNNHNKCQLREAVDGAPTLDVEPVRHGKWKDTGLGFMMLYACTHCGKQALFQSRPYPFCPNCGAKMDAQEAEG